MSTGTILSLSEGVGGTVREVRADGSIRQRLFDMGVVPNSRVVFERAALGGDPVWVRVGSVQIALRKSEAEAVSIEY